MEHVCEKELEVETVNKQKDIMTNCLMTIEEIKEIFYLINQGARVR